MQGAGDSSTMRKLPQTPAISSQSPSTPQPPPPSTEPSQPSPSHSFSPPANVRQEFMQDGPVTVSRPSTLSAAPPTPPPVGGPFATSAAPPGGGALSVGGTPRILARGRVRGMQGYSRSSNNGGVDIVDEELGKCIAIQM